jgi:hypothetical protein
MDSLQLTAGIPYSEEAPALTADATPILSADGRLLILQQQDTGNAIDIYIDTRDPVFAGRPEYPLLILGLIRQVTGQSLEFTPLTTARDVDASRIVPVTLSTVPASPAKAQPMQSTLVPLLLFATLLLLALDAAIAGGLLRRFGKLRG